jgi:hypothetical protein
MSRLSSKITEQIKKEDIPQRSRLYFITKNFFFYLQFTLAVVLGAAAFAVVLYGFLELDRELLTRAGNGAFRSMMTMLPITWLISFILFFVLAFYTLRHTKKGYRIPLLGFVIGNFILSILLGTTFYFTIGAQAIENALTKPLPFYKQLDQRKKEMWSNPERGFLAGSVVEITNDARLIILTDFEETTWQVDYSEAAFIHPRVQASLEENEIINKRIKVSGKMEENKRFKANTVLPWQRGRGGKGQMRGKMRYEREVHEKNRMINEIPLIETMPETNNR